MKNETVENDGLDQLHTIPLDTHFMNKQNDKTGGESDCNQGEKLKNKSAKIHRKIH